MFVIPTQPILASKPSSGADWVHEIKHDGYRLIVRQDGAVLRLHMRNGKDHYEIAGHAAGISVACG